MVVVERRRSYVIFSMVLLRWSRHRDHSDVWLHKRRDVPLLDEREDLESKIAVTALLATLLSVCFRIAAPLRQNLLPSPPVA